MKLIPLTLVLLTVGTFTVMADALERCEEIKQSSIHQQHEPSQKELEAVEKRYVACIERENEREERLREKEQALRIRMEARGIDYDAIKALNRLEESGVGR